MAISGKVGAVFGESGSRVPFYDEATTPNLSRDVFAIADSSKRYFAIDQPVRVFVDIEEITTGFYVQHCGGKVIFDLPLQEGKVVTVSGEAVELVQYGGLYNWSLDIGNDLSECHTFMSGGWKESLQTLQEYTGSAEGYWLNSKSSDNLGKTVVFAFYVDNTTSKTRYEGYGILSSHSLEVPNDALISETIELQGMGQLHYVEG